MLIKGFREFHQIYCVISPTVDELCNRIFFLEHDITSYKPQYGGLRLLY